VVSASKNLIGLPLKVFPKEKEIEKSFCKEKKIKIVQCLDVVLKTMFENLRGKIIEFLKF